MTPMQELLKTYLSKKTNLQDEQLNLWVSFFSTRTLRKNEYLLREGEVSKYVSFVCKGCLRLYSIDAKGREHLLQFAPEEWWVSDIESFTSGTPSAYFIDALEDSQILVMDLPRQIQLFNKIPESALFFQTLMQKRQAVTQKRIIFSMSASAEERYLDFMNTYPSFTQRIPQHMIASYLGITPESLSRIRKQVAGKKP